MTKPSDTLWEREAHTAAKHRILRGYLDAWLPIMSRWNSRLVLVDGFAGPGEYTGGEPGSPLIMLDAFLSHAYKDRITAELVYLFIEEREDRAQHLEELLSRLKLPSQVKYEVYNERYEDLFGGLLASLEIGDSTLAPTFAFIDPFGYSDASMDLTGRFLQFHRCEVLTYVPLRFVNRFVGREGQDEAMNTLFGTDEWKRARKLSGAARLEFLHDLFRDQLKSECGLEYVRSFEILTAKGTSGYHLFFGTNRELGLERMKQAMWDIDPISGQSFRDSTTSDQLVIFDATDEVDTRQLLAALRDHFGDRPFTIDEAEQFTLVETPYIKSHIRRTLKPLESDGLLEIIDPKPRRRRGTYAAGTKMRFAEPEEDRSN